MFAHAVPQKGVDEAGYAVDCFATDVAWLGWARLIVRSDNEPALAKLVVEAIKEMKVNGVEQAAAEGSIPYDPQSNGAAEAAVKLLKGTLRALHLGLEKQIGAKIPPTHPIMTWLVRHAAHVRNVRIRGTDGLTAYQRTKGRTTAGPRLIGFGEMCHFKKRAHEPLTDANDRKWNKGAWIGVDTKTSQYMVWDGDKVAFCRTIARLTDSQKWNSEELAKMRVTPWQMHEAKAPDVVFQERKPDEQAMRPDAPVVPRRMYLKPEDFDGPDGHGFTNGCARCDHARKHGHGKSSKPHSEACRKRMMEALSKTITGRVRIERMGLRIDEFAAQEIEKNDQAREAKGENEGQAGGPHVPGDTDEPPPFEPFDKAPEEHRVHQDAPNEQGDHQDVEDRQEAAEPPMEERMHDEAPEGQEPPGMDVDWVDTQHIVDETAEYMHLFLIEDRDEAVRVHGEIAATINLIGGSLVKYRRERKAQIRTILSEVYSAPRVTAMARRRRKYGIDPGVALDLTTVDEHGRPWDFDDPRQRQQAQRLLAEQRPVLLIGSPMCTAFSRLQQIGIHRRDQAKMEENRARALVHLRFACQLYLKQIARGGYFIHEHPSSADSWSEPCVQEVWAMTGVRRVIGDQCIFGQATEEGAPVKKPTGFLTNSPEMAIELEKRCQGKRGECSRPGGGRHAPCLGKVAQRAAIYHDKLCEAILRGLSKQMRADRKQRDMEVGMLAGDAAIQDGDDCVHEIVEQLRNHEGQDQDRQEQIRRVVMTESNEIWPSVPDDARPREQNQINAHTGTSLEAKLPEYGILAMYRGGVVDDLTGQPLPDELVAAGKAKELAYFEAKGVWKLVPIAECRKLTGRPPISVRWVCTNKGDHLNPNVRCRLVARQIRHPGTDSVFAPTPPLEALRTVLSFAVTQFEGESKTWAPESPERMQLSFIDISRAYFNAHVDPSEPTFVEMPPEAGAPAGMCGRLCRHMYGIQKAAEGWQEEYSCTLRELGFEQGRACPCLFFHRERGLVTSVHGDDFTTAGPKHQLDWYEGEMAKAYEMTRGGRLGPGSQDDREATVLNRVVRWTSAGLEYEADPRQVERLLAEVELAGEKVNGSATPGSKVTAAQVAEERELPAEMQTPYRAWAARANYLAADRPDALFAAKEVCRYMAKPTTLAMTALKKLCRYLRTRQRLVLIYDYQSATHLDVYSDTDHAGCIRTRKSTSGGCLMVGRHIIKTWSATQACVALSSGEAEFYGVVRAAGVALGHKSLMADLGLKIPARVWTDSSAAIGICGRQGLGKLRHIECHTLWVQQRLRQHDFQLRKIRGEVNPADLFTKYLEARTKIDQLLTLFACEIRSGRPAAAPILRREGLGQFQSGNPDEDALKSLEEQPMHDPEILPHQYAPEDIVQMFPDITPAPQGDFGERDVPGEDQELSDPIKEPFRIRVHRPHTIGTAAAGRKTTTTKNKKQKEAVADKNNNDSLCLIVTEDDNKRQRQQQPQQQDKFTPCSRPCRGPQQQDKFTPCSRPCRGKEEPTTAKVVEDAEIVESDSKDRRGESKSFGSPSAEHGRHSASERASDEGVTRTHLKPDASGCSVRGGVILCVCVFVTYLLIHLLEKFCLLRLFLQNSKTRSLHSLIIGFHENIHPR